MTSEFYETRNISSLHDSEQLCFWVQPPERLFKGCTPGTPGGWDKILRKVLKLTTRGTRGTCLKWTSWGLIFGMWPLGGLWRSPCEFQKIWGTFIFFSIFSSGPLYHFGCSISRPSNVLTLVSLVGFGHVRPFWTSAEPQELNSVIGARNETRQRALRPILWPDFLTLLPEVRIGQLIPFFTCITLP